MKYQRNLTCYQNLPLKKTLGCDDLFFWKISSNTEGGEMGGKWEGSSGREGYMADSGWGLT